MTNLGRGKTTVLYRTVSTLFWIIAYTITLTVILAICNTYYPGIDTIALSPGYHYKWSDRALVRDLTTLNALLISTIGLGWLSLVLDVTTATLKNHCKSRDKDTEDREEASFWDNAILFEGLKY